MRKRVIYMGKDPNLKHKKCKVLRQKGDVLTLLAEDEILGLIKFKTKMKDVI